MNESVKNQCILITRKLAAKPMHRYFLDKVPESTIGYYEMIKKPMWFHQVLENLISNKYKSISEWSDDIKTIFGNALIFNQPEDVLYQIAKYSEKKFSEEIRYQKIESPKSWINHVNELMKRFILLAGKSPISQGVDPLIFDIVERTRNVAPPTQYENRSVAEYILKRIDNINEVRYNVLEILKITEPFLNMSKEPITIDFEVLGNHSKSALYEYMKSRE